MVDNQFKIIGYSYDPNSKDLRLVGCNKETNTNVEVVINNPTQATLMNAMSAYDKHYANTEFDIVLTGIFE